MRSNLGPNALKRLTIMINKNATESNIRAYLNSLNKTNLNASSLYRENNKQPNVRTGLIKGALPPNARKNALRNIYKNKNLNSNNRNALNSMVNSNYNNANIETRIHRQLNSLN